MVHITTNEDYKGNRKISILVKFCEVTKDSIFFFPLQNLKPRISEVVIK